MSEIIKPSFVQVLAEKQALLDLVWVASLPRQLSDGRADVVLVAIPPPLGSFVLGMEWRN